MDADLTIDEANRRVEARYIIDMPPVLIETNLHCEYVQMINLAKLGFLAKTRCFYRTDERILLVIPGIGPVESSVIWCQSNMIGGKFLTPVDVESLSRPEQGNCTIAFEEI
jgi:hypothetical protein